MLKRWKLLDGDVTVYNLLSNALHEQWLMANMKLNLALSNKTLALWDIREYMSTRSAKQRRLPALYKKPSSSSWSSTFKQNKNNDNKWSRL